MPIRLEESLSHGEINNTVQGRVTAVFWFFGREEPVKLELQGDCHRDLAGCLLAFENPLSEEDPDDIFPPELPDLIKGIAGDITASRKIYFYESLEDDPEAYLKEPALVNSLSVEFYDTEGKRYVIDTAEFCLYTGAPEWEMDEEAQTVQLTANAERFHTYLAAVANRSQDEVDDEKPLNEFEWEARLKESDRLTDAYMEALDKYQDLPDQEELIAAAMGWNGPAVDWQIEADEVDEIFPFDDPVDFNLDGDEKGEIEAEPEKNHPLYDRSFELSTSLHKSARDMGLLDEGDSESEALDPVQTLVFSTMELSAKIAGALNGLNSDIAPEPGYVVAALKRGLPILDRALGAAESCRTKFPAEAKEQLEWVDRSSQGLFELRSSMLDLIQEFRENPF